MINKRSPLKDKPPRNPGQSLDEQIRDETYNFITGPAFLASFAILVAALEWFRYFRPHAPSPYLFTGLAIVVSGFAAYQIYHGWFRLHALRLGRDGEKEVGQTLESLRSQGFEVFHDIVGDGFNLDHVLIGPAGVFVIETKTISKPVKRKAIVRVNDEAVLVDDRLPDRNPLKQVKAQADWLREHLAKSTGCKFRVRNVILYPGWWVEDARFDKKNCWVLNPKMLSANLDREPRQLASGDIHLASYHLSRIVQSFNK
jgi:hypothetical protein